MVSDLASAVLILSWSVVDATCLRAEFDLIVATSNGHGIECEDQPCFEYVVYDINWVCKNSVTVTYCVASANCPSEVKLYYICENDECVEDPAADREFDGTELGYKTSTSLPPGWSPCTP